MIQIFKSKPIGVESIQFNGNSNRQDVEDFLGMETKSVLESETAYVAGAGPPIFSLLAETEEGFIQIYRGEWVTK